MMAFERWDVVTALFPFTDIEVRKPRPVLVLSSGRFNRDHGHLIGAMVTTGVRSRWPSDHSIMDLTPTGLRHPSVVRWKVFTLPFTIIARRIGALGPVDQEPLAAQLANIIVR
jgi:mRNA-degrading endonuclease toxin of MazEF toxin-antitoxin module